MQTMQSNLFYCKITLHVSGDTAPIIKSAKNCNRSLRYIFRIHVCVYLPEKAKCESAWRKMPIKFGRNRHVIIKLC